MLPFGCLATARIDGAQPLAIDLSHGQQFTEASPSRKGS